MPSHALTADLDGQRVDAVLHRLAPELSRTVARSLCELGAVALEGVRAGPTERVREGASLAWQDGDHELSLALGMPLPFCCDDVLVLHKPPALAVHGGPLVDDSVAARLEDLFGPGTGLAQRLDRGASGLLLVGRHKQALQALGAAMERGAIDREYLAVAAGAPERDAFTVDLPLRALDEPMGNRPKVVVDRAAGQRAVSHVRVLDRRSDCALLSVTLETGRTHQIRAHLAAVGHPVLGDPRYGDRERNVKAKATWGVHRVMLHGSVLSFPHPRTEAPTEVRACHEPDFARVFRSLRAR